MVVKATLAYVRGGVDALVREVKAVLTEQNRERKVWESTAKRYVGVLWRLAEMVTTTSHVRPDCRGGWRARPAAGPRGDAVGHDSSVAHGPAPSGAGPGPAPYLSPPATSLQQTCFRAASSTDPLRPRRPPRKAKPGTYEDDAGREAVRQGRSRPAGHDAPSPYDVM
jgi:hypothetical protein